MTCYRRFASRRSSSRRPSTREESRFIADRIPDSRVFEVPGPDFMVALLGDDVYDEVERFVRGLDAETEPETVLATVLFTDIADSTKKLAELGDRGWAEQLALGRGRGHAASLDLGPPLEPLAERFEHLALDRRRLVEHAPERTVGDHERARG